MMTPLDLIRRLRRDEEGSSITEFTLFLPVWLILFVAIVNLGKVGWGTTNTQIKAQLGLWETLVGMTDYSTEDPETMSPLAAGPKLAVMEMDRPTYAGANTVANGIERATGIAMGISGHWGESAARTVPLTLTGIAEDMESHESIGSLLDDANPYPLATLDDSLSKDDIPSAGVADILASLIQASGGLHAIGAGIRYGAVMSEELDSEIELSGGWTNVSANARYDALVPPAPLTGFSADRVPFALARLMAESDETYAVMLNWGESEWSDQSPGNFSYDENAGQDEANEDVERQCRQNGFGDDTSYCQSCAQDGHTTKSACDCARDPNCPAPPSNP